MGEITPLAESAEIDYRALAKGPITATASFAGDREALLAELGGTAACAFRSASR